MANWYAKQVSVAGEWEAQDFTASPLPPVTITGDLAATEAQDTIAASGIVTAGPITITGTLSVTEAQDSIASNGDLAHVGNLSAIEAQDTSTFVGDLAHVGALSATDGQDIFEAIGGGLSAFAPPPALFIVNMGRMMSR
jgi:hypothetical protein